MKTELARRLELSDCKEIIKKHEEAVEEWYAALERVRDDKLYELDGCATFHEWAKAHCALRGYRRLRNRMIEDETRKMLAETTGEEYAPKRKTDSPSPPNNPVHTHPVIDVETTNKKASTKPEPVCDAEGNELKFEALKNWGRREEVKQMLADFKLFRDRLETILDPKDVIWHGINFQMVELRMDELSQILSEALPHAVCTECQGAPSTRGGKCGFCGSKGLISKFKWKVHVPEDKKEMMAKIAKGRK